MHSYSFNVKIYHNDYYNLISLGWIEDFLIIHLLYFLWTLVNTLYYLSHDNISTKRMLIYWDIKYSKFNSDILSEDLYRDINSFKTYKEINKIQASNQSRTLKDGTILTGNFILILSPSGIYSRFSKCFGWNLQGFDYTSNDISRLSERNIFQLRKEKRIRFQYHYVGIKFSQKD